MSGALPARVGQTNTVRIYHKPHGKPYAYGSTHSAINRAHEGHYFGIDLDLTLDATGRGWVNHWRQCMVKDAWRDTAPKGARMDHRKSIVTMRPKQVKRLKSPWGHILAAAAASLACLKAHLMPCFEAKHDARFYQSAWWASFKRRQQGRPFLVMSLPGRGRDGVRKLKAAHAAGIRTMWLARGPVPAEARAFVTFVKRGDHITRLNPDPR